ncbi:MAG TPA: hypothetical protein VLT45_23310, partial [Kofleriaceae bacterium]|nr:hypothetical protein [Kofleriaceae bacterium]
MVVTTPDRAWAAADANDPSPHVTGGITPTNVTDQGLALTGWGRLDLILAPAPPGGKDGPLTAQATFLIDPEGDITARGILRVPRTYELMPAYVKDFGSLPLFPIHKVIAAADLLEFAGVEARLFADLKAKATAGPFTLRDLIAEGTYSTRPGAGSEISLAGSFNASAEGNVTASAGVELRATVGIHLPFPLP